MAKDNIRNLKDGHWYWVDKEVLSQYGRRLGPSGIAVYNVLAYFANSRTQSCFPTQKAIADLLGVSPRTVRRKIGLLRGLNLIEVEKRGRNSLYWLLRSGPHRTGGTATPDRRDPSQRTGEQRNNIYLNKFNNKKDVGKSISYKGSEPQTREELLALDLAHGLDDQKNVGFYLSYARKYPEGFLRKILGEVEEIPQKNLKKGRAAYFNYLLKKRVRQTTTHIGP